MSELTSSRWRCTRHRDDAAHGPLALRCRHHGWLYTKEPERKYVRQTTVSSNRSGRLLNCWWGAGKTSKHPHPEKRDFVLYVNIRYVLVFDLIWFFTHLRTFRGLWTPTPSLLSCLTGVWFVSPWRHSSAHRDGNAIGEEKRNSFLRLTLQLFQAMVIPLNSTLLVFVFVFSFHCAFMVHTCR